ncbi:MAG: DNA polymerase IV [Clostridia bacterium]|nr:DNA polymerase IV [Clostridia bacterium]
MDRKILHIDVNNAFLSWTAVDRLKHGETLDLRTVPSIVGGDEEKRRGIVVAKSNVAKKFGIQTAEPIYMARRKCPSVLIVPANHELYEEYSDKLYKLFLEYTEKVERFSIDECFLDLTEYLKPGEDLVKTGIEIKERVKKEFNFTVNVGVSDDKILAKVASDFEKPDKIHTLFKSEIEEKLWKLPIGEMFLVGKKSVPKLNRMGIRTIGDLAKTDKAVLIKNFGKYGYTIWKYANGESNEDVNYIQEKPKGIGNSVTLPYDVGSIEELEVTLVELVQKVSYRLRKKNMYATVVNVQLKNNEFKMVSHQKKLMHRTDTTNEILVVAKELLKELYTGDLIRLIGVRVDGLIEKEEFQISMFDMKEESKNRKLDNVIDNLKDKYGYDILTRATELKNSSEKKS